jgi:Acyl-coenzyme A:6-aminopenicillanic acid acyl-transferase
MQKIFFFFIISITLLIDQSYACTTAIVSGKFTNNGRPLIFKHRDTGTLQNRIMYFEDGKYKYMGVVNSQDTLGKEVWMGTNSAGFCIMNSASYNLKTNDTTNIQDREGIVMKLALKECKTLEDFEKLLDELPKPLGVEANFGVIDAFGGAAYYETDNWGFTKIDVNDPKIAPFGYVIRTNYSFTGTRDDGYGYIRYLTAEELFYNAEATKSIDHKFFLKDISRSLKHSLLKKNWAKDFPKKSNDPFYIITQDYIPRYSSASSFLCEGVKKGEPAELTTMWTILGYQLCSVAIPTWISAGPELPNVAIADETGNAPICDAALKLKKQVYPIERGNGTSYMNLTSLYNKDDGGIYQKLRKIEDEIFFTTEMKISQWRIKGLVKTEVQDYYHWLDTFIEMQYKKEFGIILK